MRAIDRDLIRGGHYGQRSCEPRKQAEHMAAPTNAAYVKKVLANSEPSTHGAISDDMCSPRVFRLLTQCMVRPCGARRFVDLGDAVLHQCIRPLVGALLRAIMDISARAMSIPITQVIAVLSLLGIACSLSLAPPGQCPSLAGQEHGRTIPLAVMAN
jgi:hypothetical protein